MKNLLLIFTVSCIAVVSSYGQNSDIQTMLQDQQNRDMVYQTIIENQTYMREFMQEMRQNKEAMQRLNKNREKKEMMQNPERMQKMMHMLHQKGMISDDCMKAGMQKMKADDMQMKEEGRKHKRMKMESER